MFKGILNDSTKRKEFEDNLQKFLTGDYNSFEEFQNNVKETLGINADRQALEAYTQLTEQQNMYSTKIEDSQQSLRNNFNTKYRELNERMKELRNLRGTMVCIGYLQYS